MAKASLSGVDLDDVAERLRALPPSCGPVRIIAVDGPARSGKTTFASRLAETLGGAQVVHTDDFEVPWDDPLAWWQPLADKVLTPLGLGKDGGYRRYDWRAGRNAEWVRVRPAPVVLVDGVGAAWRGAADRLAFAIWVEAPEKIRLQRAGRTYSAADWAQWTAAEDAHFATDHTRDRANLIITL